MRKNLARGLRMLEVGYQLFGLKKSVSLLPLVFSPVATRLSLRLDDLFFRGYQHVPVERPIFILGNPRSGTTFFHRVLAEDPNASTFLMWEMFSPAISARVLIRPLIHHLYRLFERDLSDESTVFGDGIHDTGLDKVEEEEVLLLTMCDSQMNMSLTPLAFDDREYPELVFPDQSPPEDRRRSMSYLRGCFQRQLYLTGRTRVVAKMPYSTLRIRSIMEEFPDAILVILLRSPLETLPSHLTMHRGYYDNRWGLQNIPKDRLERYWKRRYQYNVAMYRYIEEIVRENVVPKSQLMLLPYEQLKSDLSGAISRFCEVTGLPLSAQTSESIRALTEQQRGWKRVHQNAHLEEFGLSEEMLRRDLEPTLKALGITF